MQMANNSFCLQFAIAMQKQLLGILVNHGSF